MSRLLIGLVLFASLCLSCFAAVGNVPNGFVITGDYVGMSGDFESGNYRSSEACVTSWLGWFAAGDASINAACQRGNITKVMSVSHRVAGYIGIAQVYCVVVRGY